MRLLPLAYACFRAASTRLQKEYDWVRTRWYSGQDDLMCTGDVGREGWNGPEVISRNLQPGPEVLSHFGPLLSRFGPCVASPDFTD